MVRQGGGTGHNGVVFRLRAVGGRHSTETVLYSFKGGVDGSGPSNGLAFDKSGNLYGTALGGESFLGVVFRLKPSARGYSWPLTVLHNFTGAPDGNHPTATVIFDRSGNLYSTTLWGGTAQSCQGGCGTVLEVAP
jgi:hypothetical protein